MSGARACAPAGSAILDPVNESPATCGAAGAPSASNPRRCGRRRESPLSRSAVPPSTTSSVVPMIRCRCCVENARPEDDVVDAGFVLERSEDDAIGGLRMLQMSHQSADAHHACRCRPIPGPGACSTRVTLARAQQRQRMTPGAQTELLVIAQDFLPFASAAATSRHCSFIGAAAEAAAAPARTAERVPDREIAMLGSGLPECAAHASAHVARSSAARPAPRPRRYRSKRLLPSRSDDAQRFFLPQTLDQSHPQGAQARRRVRGSSVQSDIRLP